MRRPEERTTASVVLHLLLCLRVEGEPVLGPSDPCAKRTTSEKGAQSGLIVFWNTHTTATLVEEEPCISHAYTHKHKPPKSMQESLGMYYIYTYILCIIQGYDIGPDTYTHGPLPEFHPKCLFPHVQPPDLHVYMYTDTHSYGHKHSGFAGMPRNPANSSILRC